MKYAWIAKHKTYWPTTLTCEVLGVSASGYFEHWRRKDTEKPSKSGVTSFPTTMITPDFLPTVLEEKGSLLRASRRIRLTSSD